MSSNVSDQNPVEQVTEVVQVAPTIQELSLVAVENEHAVTTSLRVAEVFGKEHYNVMKAIKSLDCSEEFRAVNFNASKIDYQNGNIKKQLPMYYITRDGFMFLVMGFTGKTAAKWKEAYIKAFNEMEAKIRAEQMAKAIEEHDRKEAEEYEKLLEREEREEAAIDARVAAMPPVTSRKRQAEPLAGANEQTGGIIIENYNGRRVVSSLTLAKLQGREHRYVCESIQRMKKYFVRPGSVIFRCGRTVNRGFGKGYESPTGVVYYITAEAFKVMCKHCTTIDKDMQSEVRKAFRRAQGPKNHGKPVATTQAPQQTKSKAPTTPPTPTETAKPQQGKPTAATMPQTPTDLMQRFVKAVGVMMGMDTDNLMNLMNKGE
ncbi:Rha family transcriptional regulator [uncultured Prevotella sp.]|uniref:Rha family transcriptional regulator n=1 Tax=uncultured Prevotella sp. TaxID=159272 RepID=UPI0027E2CF33|nr:Rha family transcriptional regulator [uncultured Prevotella sp.]